jgi:hypothetical protein
MDLSPFFFADDSIIFSEASDKGAERIRNILEDYHHGSGQLVNKQKSAIFFSSNCPDTDKNHVMQCLGIQTEALGEKYLGLPTAVGRSTKEAFEHLPGQVCNLVYGWGERNLNYAAREVLLKSVAQSIPVYSMSCFRLSPQTCEKITSVMAKYFWGGTKDQRKMHWIRWSQLARPKSEGGMGFRDLKYFNMAMLGKQAWRLMTNPTSLCARILKGKYFPNSNILQAKKGKHTSHTWRAIYDGKNVLQKGIIKRIGNGQNTKVWEDNWIPNRKTMKPL